MAAATVEWTHKCALCSCQISILLTRIGGYELWCQEVADGLGERGHEVQVLTSSWRNHAGGSAQHLTVRRTLYLEAPLDYYKPADFFFRRTRRERHNVRELRRLLDEFHPDVCMVWGMWNLSKQLPYLAERWLNGRVAYYLCSYWPIDVDPDTSYWNLRVNHRIAEPFKQVLRATALSRVKREDYVQRLRFEHAVCCSQYVRDTLRQNGSLPESSGVLLGGTDPAPFLQFSKQRDTLNSTRLKLLYFGRLIEDKGVHTAVEALGLLRKRKLDRDLSLTIMGNGHPQYEADLRKTVRRLELGRVVEFVKQVPREQIPAWLGCHDVFLFTSIWPEPMARTVMEAMASGLLVIGTDVGGQTEMLEHGVNALTFQPEDSEKLADHIALAASKPSLRRQLSKEGQQLVLEGFSLDRMIDDMERYLLRIVESG